MAKILMIILERMRQLNVSDNLYLTKACAIAADNSLRKCCLVCANNVNTYLQCYCW